MCYLSHYTVSTPEAAKQMLEANRKRQLGHESMAQNKPSLVKNILVQGTPVVGKRSQPMEELKISDG